VAVLVGILILITMVVDMVVDMVVIIQGLGDNVACYPYCSFTMYLVEEHFFLIKYLKNVLSFERIVKLLVTTSNITI
jgi:hypothetical protein